MKWILIAVMVTGSPRPVSMTATFEDQQACWAAVKELQKALPYSLYWVCVPDRSKPDERP